MFYLLLYSELPDVEQFLCGSDMKNYEPQNEKQINLKNR